MDIMENAEIEIARRIVEHTGTSLFLTGKAGTGKTTFLRRLKEEGSKQMVVAAPTGIAAINAGGVTLHSFFQLDFGPFVPGMKRNNSRSMRFSKEKIKIIRGMDLLVIDEVSMVRADMLDAVDAVLRRFRDRHLPFGGVQLLLIGDLQQLPPVVKEEEWELLKSTYRSPYFFESRALQELNYVTVELKKVYRQNDEYFLSMLNAIRENRGTTEVLDALNTRCHPGFDPDDSEGYIRLTTHNVFADNINRQRMQALPTQSYIFEATVKGDFPESSFPAERTLELKEGAQVMFIKNDTGIPAERKYFNGMLGRVLRLSETEVVVLPAGADEPISVQPAEWENKKYEINEEKHDIKEVTAGVFQQYPLRAAWAITVHKSQGLTFDRAIIDVTRSFAHGQTYVALSRCRSLEGLVLNGRIPANAVICDHTVNSYMSGQTANQVDEGRLFNLSRNYVMELVCSLFNFEGVFSALEGITRLMQEDFFKVYPQRVKELERISTEQREAILDVGRRFCTQCRNIDREWTGTCEENPRLQQRIKDACGYFIEKLHSLLDFIDTLPTTHDNRKTEAKLAERVALFRELFAVRMALLTKFKDEDFSVALYLATKSEVALSGVKAVSAASPMKAASSEFSSDNVHPELFDRLSKWRYNLAKERDIPAFTIMSTRTLLAVANYMPTSYEELAMIPGIGKAKIATYGDSLIDIVDDFRNTSANLVLVPLPKPTPRRKHKK